MVTTIDGAVSVVSGPARRCRRRSGAARRAQTASEQRSRTASASAATLRLGTFRTFLARSTAVVLCEISVEVRIEATSGEAPSRKRAWLACRARLPSRARSSLSTASSIRSGAGRRRARGGRSRGHAPAGPTRSRTPAAGRGRYLPATPPPPPPGRSRQSAAANGRCLPPPRVAHSTAAMTLPHTIIPARTIFQAHPCPSPSVDFPMRAGALAGNSAPDHGAAAAPGYPGSRSPAMLSETRTAEPRTDSFARCA